MATSAVVFEDDATMIGFFCVDGKGEFRRSEFFEEAVDFSKVFFPVSEFVWAILADEHELHESFVTFFSESIDVQI